MLNIKNEYIDNKGNNYNIRNICLDDKSDMMNLGKYLTETKRELGYFYSSSDNLTEGVYIYQSNYDPTKILRIYKDWINYKYVFHNDVELISQLQNLQKNIKLTEFPTGIITLDNYVVGQEMKYYEGYETLSKLNNGRNIIYYYQQILNILKELENFGIIYTDIHSKNFMVKDKDVKLIDFENDSIKLKYGKVLYSDMINLLKFMINSMNEKFNINFKLDKSSTLNEVEEEIMIKTKTL